eukprot:gnl/MRDRNA2_/MRDRNA2_31235_c0_seq1.p1 gnl/MRDRNA2_/MRDRNA2_31235_c0~~gnl/MRDRNA2_/MRDRNA2_31235_c0_seq1.p1  ORF type:complete len:605 (+),score=114.23 gnl/MRDRNA2_/MRDRNA2_31235_c0_seq1:2-1816(+)
MGLTTQEIVEHLQKSKFERKCYDQVDFSENKIQVSGLRTLLNNSGLSVNLRVLNLEKNQLCDDAATNVLSNVCKKCTGIAELNLSFNLITGKGAENLVKAVSAWRSRGERPLWLLLEGNNVQQPKALLAEMMHLHSVCDLSDMIRCNKGFCCNDKRVHLPFFTNQHVVLNEEFESVGTSTSSSSRAAPTPPCIQVPQEEQFHWASHLPPNPRGDDNFHHPRRSVDDIKSAVEVYDADYHAKRAAMDEMLDAMDSNDDAWMDKAGKRALEAGLTEFMIHEAWRGKQDRRREDALAEMLDAMDSKDDNWIEQAGARAVKAGLTDIAIHEAWQERQKVRGALRRVACDGSVEKPQAASGDQVQLATTDAAGSAVTDKGRVNASLAQTVGLVVVPKHGPKPPPPLSPITESRTGNSQPASEGSTGSGWVEETERMNALKTTLQSKFSKTSSKSSDAQGLRPKAKAEAKVKAKAKAKAKVLVRRGVDMRGNVGQMSRDEEWRAQEQLWRVERKLNNEELTKRKSVSRSSRSSSGSRSFSPQDYSSYSETSRSRSREMRSRSRARSRSSSKARAGNVKSEAQDAHVASTTAPESKLDTADPKEFADWDAI